MNSQSKRCPSCAGTGAEWLSTFTGEGYFHDCSTCKGTRVVPAEDRPEPEGDHTQVLSRRRSLPVPVELLEYIDEQYDEARREQETKGYFNYEEVKLMNRGKADALASVLGYIRRGYNQAPEGNTESSDLRTVGVQKSEQREPQVRCDDWLGEPNKSRAPDADSAGAERSGRGAGGDSTTNKPNL